jgi:hypothetical protein
MHEALETDYLVVGAGAAGMAFTDALLAHSDATVTIVDRRHAPGGHWVDAYPFVRLHQPSAFYGVDSVPLGRDSIDATGPNAGFYELAGADEIRAYYADVMHRHFLPTGRVRYFPCCDYVADVADPPKAGGAPRSGPPGTIADAGATDHNFISRLTGKTTRARVRRKLVDTSYVQGKIPATSPPPFAMAEGVRCITPTELARLEPSAERFVIVGGGKTSLDACVWLLERGVAPAAIRWIRPRDSWWINRKYQQPRTLLPSFAEGAAMQVEAMAQAGSIDELFARLEAESFFVRIDPEITPTMFRGAIVGERELELLRRIDDVVHLGHVQRIERREIVLDQGRVQTDERTVHVHCAVRGVGRPPIRPIFEPGRLTMQPFSWGFSCHQFALLAVLEAAIESDDEKNALCPPISWWDTNTDFLTAFLRAMSNTIAIGAHPVVGKWTKASRLNPMSGIGPYRSDPRVVASRERIKRYGAAAAVNLQKLLTS